MPRPFNGTFTTDLELEDGSVVEVDVEYEFEPEEPQTRHSPHFPESVTIYKVKTPRGSIDVTEAQNELLVDEILDHLHGQQEPDEDGVW